MSFGTLAFVFASATLLRTATGACEDISLWRGLAGIVVDTCPSKSGTCCGKSGVQCLSASWSAVCRCPDCPTTTTTTNAQQTLISSAFTFLTKTTVPSGATLPGSTTTNPQVDCATLSTNCEMCLEFGCAYCVRSESCVRKGAVCEEPGDVAGTKCPAPVDGAPQQIKIGNVTVNVAVMGQFDLPISSGLWFSWTFDPAVAISWIELAEFDVGEQAVLTITRAADNSTEKILITELRQDLIDRTEAGFNIYRLDAVGNSSFKINTLSIVPPISVPMTEPPAPLSQTAVMEPDGVGGLAIGLIIGGILLCLLALAVVLFVVRRRRSDATTTTINVTPVAAAPTRTSTYSVGLQSQYGAAPATRLAEDMTEQNQYGEAHQVIYGDAPSLGGAYTDPRRGSVPSHYDGVDAPLH